MPAQRCTKGRLGAVVVCCGWASGPSLSECWARRHHKHKQHTRLHRARRHRLRAQHSTKQRSTHTGLRRHRSGIFQHAERRLCLNTPLECMAAAQTREVGALWRAVLARWRTAQALVRLASGGVHFTSPPCRHLAQVLDEGRVKRQVGQGRQHTKRLARVWDTARRLAVSRPPLPAPLSLGRLLRNRPLGPTLPRLPTTIGPHAGWRHV